MFRVGRFKRKCCGTRVLFEMQPREVGLAQDITPVEPVEEIAARRSEAIWTKLIESFTRQSLKALSQNASPGQSPKN